MTLFDLLKNDGVDLKKAAGTHGGEWCGACPFCGGDDRFRVWPELKNGRFWCRHCNKKGDAVQYLRDSKGLSYREACEIAGVEAKGRKASPSPRQQRAGFTPREATVPPATWQEKATAFFTAAQRTLQEEAGREARAFLKERGLSDFSVQCLGWNKAEFYQNRETWGLPPEKRSDGRPKRLWLPAGLVIPLWEHGKVVRLRIRRSDPGTGPRYVITGGSSMQPMIFSPGLKIFTLVESELDGFLIWQEAGDLTGVISLGSAAIKPDKTSNELLQGAALILVALDADEPGALSSRFFANTYGAKARRWPVPLGKDPSEAHQEGVDIKAWIQAGLE